MRVPFIHQALAALLARRRAADFDEAYAAYGAHPLDETDEWGDLASFRAQPAPREDQHR